MGNLQDWVFSLQEWGFCLRKHYSLGFFLFFLILSSTHSRFVPPIADRAISKLNKADSQIGVRREKWMVENRMIGSRPPRCDSKCRGCGHCVAVQVPIAPPLLLKFKKTTKKSAVYSTTKTTQNPKFIAYSRGDDISNYKPMCWMCKCGDFIFNP